MTAIDESYPFDSSAVFEAQWRKMARLWCTTGVVSGLAVSPNAGLVLNVATGGGWVDGFYAGVTATKTVTLSTAHATLPRIDVVVLRLDPVANTVTLEVLTGTANVSPAAPSLTQLEAGNYELALAEVYVGATVTSITAANITDRRMFSTPAAGGGSGGSSNPVRNASAKVWQDGTSIACGAGAYTADGWYGRRAGAATGQTVSRQAAADTAGGAPYCFRQLRDNGNSSTAQMIHEQSIPSEDSLEYAGQTVTLSARVRALAGYTGGAASLALITGTGTDQSVRTPFTGAATAGTGTVTPSTSWQTVYVTVTLASSVTELGVQKTWTPTGTAGANDGLEWKDVRIDRGTVPLNHAPLKYEDDLREAQRYYELVTAAQDAAWISTPTTNGNPYYRSVDFMVVKRAAPTMTLTFSDRDSFPTSAPTLVNAGTKAFVCYQTASATANSSYYAFTWKADARI